MPRLYAGWYLGIIGLAALWCLSIITVVLLDSSRDPSTDILQRKEMVESRRPPLCCDSDLDSSRPVIDKIMVSSSLRETANSDRILCFMMTHSGSHRTKVRAVLETWGRKCDGWLIASNETDGKVGAIRMQTPARYNLLWTKLNESVQYIADHHVNDYDWFYKVDDDSFVVMENLWRFLQTKKRDVDEPQIFGYLLTDQFWGQQQRYFDLSDQNRAFGSFFLSKVRKDNAKVDYLAGGSGYIMNRAYLRKLILALESNLTLYGEIPEDLGHGATMLAHNIEPFDSTDSLGRQHFIPESPALWNVRHQAHIRSGSIPANRNCCALYSVAFHHISPQLMHYLYDQFYLCRG